MVLCGAVLLQGCAEVVVVGGMGGLIVAHDARSTKGWFQDQVIEWVARRVIDDDQKLKDQGDFNITSFKQTVLMTGQVRSLALKKRATRLLAAIDNVRSVHNEVVVVRSPVDVSWAQDSYTTAKVKARLIFNDFDPTKVKVVSNLGNVYLMGRLSHAESEEVISMIGDVDGVGTITKVFEYVD